MSVDLGVISKQWISQNQRWKQTHLRMSGELEELRVGRGGGHVQVAKVDHSQPSKG